MKTNKKSSPSSSTKPRPVSSETATAQNQRRRFKRSDLQRWNARPAPGQWGYPRFEINSTLLDVRLFSPLTGAYLGTPRVDVLVDLFTGQILKTDLLFVAETAGVNIRKFNCYKPQLKAEAERALCDFQKMAKQTQPTGGLSAPQTCQNRARPKPVRSPK